MDALIAFFAEFGPQHWLMLGLVLLIAEMASGTTYLLWPAVAAFLTALVAYLGLSNWIAQIALFAVLVIVLTAFGRPLVRNWRKEGAASGLNERAAALIGARGVVASFANGAGSVRVGDTVWRAVSEDTIETGAEVEVAAVDGTVLKVKRV
jgi:membrane protein implicated in regulation of membrane protease activity